MVVTSFAPSMVPLIPLRVNRPDVLYFTVDYRQARAWRVEPTDPGGSWWVTVSVDVVAEGGASGSMRLRTSDGAVSTDAVISQSTQRIRLGWVQIPASDTTVFLEMRQLYAGGGIRIQRAEGLAMQSPPVAARGGPHYPPGQEPLQTLWTMSGPPSGGTWTDFSGSLDLDVNGGPNIDADSIDLVAGDSITSGGFSQPTDEFHIWLRTTLPATLIPGQVLFTNRNGTATGDYGIDVYYDGIGLVLRHSDGSTVVESAAMPVTAGQPATFQIDKFVSPAIYRLSVNGGTGLVTVARPGPTPVAGAGPIFRVNGDNTGANTGELQIHGITVEPAIAGTAPPPDPDPGPVDPPSADIYPYYTGTTINVGATDNLQTAINNSAAGDRVIFAGDHRGEGMINIPRRIDLQGTNRLTSLIEQAETTAEIEGLWMSNFTINKEGAIASSFQAGFINQTGGPGVERKLTRCRFNDITVRGRGLSHGIALNRRYDNNRIVMHNCSVYDIQATGYEVFADNARTWGLVAHDIYRIDDINQDCDAARYCGSNQRHSGFWFYAMHEYDAFSDESPGRFNPTGPLGSFFSPHHDGWQTFNLKKYDNVAFWTTQNVIFEDGVVDYRPTSGLGGTGGRHCFGTSNHNTAGVFQARNITVRRCALSSMGAAPFTISGVENLSIEDNLIWLTNEINPTTPPFPGLDNQFRTFSGAGIGVGSGNGPTTNPNLRYVRNTVYAAEAGQTAYHTHSGGVAPADETGSVRIVGNPPDTSQFDDAYLMAPAHRPTDEQVLSWLNGPLTTDGSRTFSTTPIYTNQFDAALTSEWEVYNANPGNGGFGVRHPQQVQPFVEGSSIHGGSVLRLTASNVAGQHYHGGVKLLRPFEYMQATIRVRVSDDASQVTSGVVIFWPLNNQFLFPPADNPEGPWPAGGELDYWETFNNRDTRTPTQTYIHRLNPTAVVPYTSGDDQVPVSQNHGGVDQSDWHTIVCNWTHEEISMTIDGGGLIVLTNNRDEIPHWPMELTLQLDAWSNTPPAAPVTMDIDLVEIRPWI